MCSFINCTCHQMLLELWKEGMWMAGSCRVCLTWDMCTGLSEILNYNEQWAALLGAYMCTELQTQWHNLCCYGWLNSLSQTLLHSHSSHTIHISIVVMLGFWWCQFNIGILAWGLYLSSTKFFLWFQFNITVGYACRLSSVGCHLCQFKISMLG